MCIHARTGSSGSVRVLKLQTCVDGCYQTLCLGHFQLSHILHPLTPGCDGLSRGLLTGWRTSDFLAAAISLPLNPNGERQAVMTSDTRVWNLLISDLKHCQTRAAKGLQLPSGSRRFDTALESQGGGESEKE